MFKQGSAGVAARTLANLKRVYIVTGPAGIALRRRRRRDQLQLLVMRLRVPDRPSASHTKGDFSSRRTENKVGSSSAARSPSFFAAPLSLPQESAKLPSTHTQTRRRR
jgi:hypothetical protein